MLVFNLVFVSSISSSSRSSGTTIRWLVLLLLVLLLCCCCCSSIRSSSGRSRSSSRSGRSRRRRSRRSTRSRGKWQVNSVRENLNLVRESLLMISLMINCHYFCSRGALTPSSRYKWIGAWATGGLDPQIQKEIITSGNPLAFEKPPTQTTYKASVETY